MDIDSLKGAALKEYAKSVNLKGRSRMKVDEIRQALKSLQTTLATAPEPEPTPEPEVKAAGKRNWHTFRQEFVKHTGLTYAQASKLAGRGQPYHELYLKYKDADNYDLAGACSEVKQPEPSSEVEEN